jgi:pimeloyl-ACP methyl ester carboxylesterase
MTRCIHSILAALAALVALAPADPAAQQSSSSVPAPQSSTFTIFYRSIAIGTEQVSVDRIDGLWTIRSTGRIGAPVNATLSSLQLRYDDQWRARELTMDSVVAGQTLSFRTVVEGTTARSEIRSGTTPVEATKTIDETAILLTNPFFAAYEAVWERLKNAPQGSTLQVYLAPFEPTQATVGTSAPERIQTLARTIPARRTSLTLMPAGQPPQVIEILGDEAGRLLRVSIPSEGIDVVREDIGSVSARRVTISRAGDEEVRVPATGFSLAGTISKPADPRAVRLPAVVLVGGVGVTDRDETIGQIPIFGELAGGLADAGFLVLRYDRRGVGQSGGRPEAATLTDYADDLRAAVRFMNDRRDVDRRRIAVLAHGEGGPVGLLAASRDDRIRALVLAAAPGVTGGDLTLAQATRAAGRSNRSDAEKQATLDLQKRIQTAVLTGKGWETIPPMYRQQADTPWFQSFLLFDPAKVIPNVDQPLLIVHGLLDAEVDPSNADRLEALARARRRAAVDVVRLPNVNHLLTPATTGEVDEYSTLKDRTISPDVHRAISDWLLKTLPAAAR